jgi:signal transduction histidine kinase
MAGTRIKHYGIAVAAWLPFFAIWVFYAMSLARYSLRAAIVTSLISMGSASLLGIGVWHLCQLRPWPFHLRLRFYLQQILFACAYTVAWSVAVTALETLRRGTNFWHGLSKNPFLPWQLLTGLWLYGLFAGVSYAVQTRQRLHEKEALAARAEALATAARLDAIRARLNPHFLFNALHTLSALVKFRPTMAETAIEHLGDMLRYSLKEDGRELVEFSEEYDFTRQYIALEKLRYEDRLKVELQIDPGAFNFDVPPFSIQALTENAVRHAISIRPEGGSIWIICSCSNRGLSIVVRDDGPGGSELSESHQFGLRSLRERLHAAFGDGSEMRVEQRPEGFEASFLIPGDSLDTSSPQHAAVSERE